MLVDQKYKHFLLDFGDYLKSEALAAKADYDQSKGQTDEDQKWGVVFGYYSVMTTFLQTLQGFDISPREAKLEGFDPDAELLSRKRRSS